MDAINKATNSATNSASQHTEEQKKFYDNLTADEKKKQSYTEWVQEAYHDQYEEWMPWIEDQYLKWFGKGDNKASYATKDHLSQTKVTGIKQVDQVQDDVNNLVGNQIGKKGLAAPIGNAVSKDGINRMERNGKDEKGSYGGPAAGYTDSLINNSKSGAQYVGNFVSNGVKGLGSYIGLGGGSSGDST